MVLENRTVRGRRQGVTASIQLCALGRLLLRASWPTRTERRNEDRKSKRVKRKGLGSQTGGKCLTVEVNSRNSHTLAQAVGFSRALRLGGSGYLLGTQGVAG